MQLEDKLVAIIKDSLEDVSYSEVVMSQWDAARKAIAEGEKASWPRDWFETTAGYVDNPPDLLNKLARRLIDAVRAEKS